MTEDEAKTKWCPFVRLCVKGASAGNRYGTQHTTIENPSECRCIGSQCMAWRVSKPSVPKGSLTFNRTGKTCKVGEVECENYEGRILTQDQPEEGYCGLAWKQ